MAQSILKKMKPLESVIASQGHVNPKAKKSKNKSLDFSLNLTALIDAFAILVIFLLSNYNGDAENLDLSAKTQLPKANYSEVMNMGTVVKIENNKYFVSEKEVSVNKLFESIYEARKQNENKPDEIKKSLIILADRNVDFEILSPIIRSGGQAGFESYKFGVLPSGAGMPAAFASR